MLIYDIVFFSFHLCPENLVAKTGHTRTSALNAVWALTEAIGFVIWYYRIEKYLGKHRNMYENKWYLYRCTQICKILSGFVSQTMDCEVPSCRYACTWKVTRVKWTELCNSFSRKRSLASKVIILRFQFDLNRGKQPFSIYTTRQDA